MRSLHALRLVEMTKKEERLVEMTKAISAITFKNGVNHLLGKLLRYQTDDPYNREAANHSDGSAVNGVDGIADDHVYHCEAYTPDEASPDGSLGDTTPVEAQHKRREERTSQRTPRDTHELCDERRRIQGDEQRDGNKKHNKYAHDYHLTTLDLLCHDIVDGSFLHLTRQ